MARMWPKVLPDWVLADGRRKAEVAVFRRLESVLDDGWQVFYSRPWWGIGPKGGEIDGEADFIVTHAEHGLLFLEVKGGAISYDPAREQWTSRDRNGITHNIKDPVRQALGCKHQYLRKLRSVPGWPRSHVRFRHGVILPDCAMPDRSALGIGPYDKSLFCCMQHFEHALDRWVADRLASHPSSGGETECGPGDEGVRIIGNLLAGPVTLRIPASREVQGELEAMEMLLTGAQLAVLTIFDAHPRVLVEGGAGTGKTVLAVEVALRHAQNGQSVLFCCRSGPLADHVAARLQGAVGVEASRFEDLAARVKGTFRSGSGAGVLGQWDVVVIDEGQDFDWEWWDVIETLVRRDSGLLRVFADSNQAVYRLRDDLETKLQAISIPLRHNLRNTRSIARATDPLYRGPLILAPGPEGKAPTCLPCDLETAVHSAEDAALHLLRAENLRPSMLAILVPNAEIREKIRSHLARMHVSTTDASRRIGEAVTVDTVMRFKGLEAAVVLLIADHTLGSDQELSYVGVSRARSRLMVYGPIVGTKLEAALKVGR